MADFSWSDALRAAFGPCLSCLPHRGPQLPPDEDDARSGLRGLLAETDSDAANDTDALSLHSTFNRPRRKRRRGAPKAIRVMGWHLFGQPIRLPDDEAHADESTQSRPRPHAPVDADAAPLDAEAIARLSNSATSTPTFAEHDDASARQKAEDDARRARRRERKERKKAALALALEGPSPGEEFEGFQGSGSPSAGAPSPFRPSAYPISPPASSDGFGSMHLPRGMEHTEDGDAADFDASAYTRAPRPGASVDGGSGTRSRTSASRSSATASSEGGHAAYRYQQFAPPEVLSPVSGETPTPKANEIKKKTRAPDSPSPAAPSFPGVAPMMRPPAGEMPSAGFPSAGLGGRTRSGSSNMGAFLARRGDE